MCILPVKKHNTSNTFCLVGYFKHERHFIITGSFQGGLLEGAERLLNLYKNQYLPGDVSSTCLDLIRSKLCVGGGCEYTDAGSNSPNRDIPDPTERAAIQISLCHLWGSCPKTSHRTLCLLVGQFKRSFHLPFSFFMRLSYNMV